MCIDVYVWVEYVFVLCIGCGVDVEECCGVLVVVELVLVFGCICY